MITFHNDGSITIETDGVRMELSPKHFHFELPEGAGMLHLDADGFIIETRNKFEIKNDG